MTDTQANILGAAIDWTKAEMFSSAFFILFGALFLLASFALWQLGRTDMAKAYVIPLLVTGGLLIVIGAGLVISNQMRLSAFPTAFNADSQAFLASEIARAEKTIDGYTNAVFRIIPLIIASCALLVIFMNGPIWRASLICIIAMMAVIMIIDTNANARLEVYKDKLVVADQSQ